MSDSVTRKEQMETARQKRIDSEAAQIEPNTARTIIPLTMKYEASMLDIECPPSFNVTSPQVDQRFTVDVLSADCSVVWGYEFYVTLARPIKRRPPSVAEIEFARTMKPALDKLQLEEEVPE